MKLFSIMILATGLFSTSAKAGTCAPEVLKKSIRDTVQLDQINRGLAPSTVNFAIWTDNLSTPSTTVLVTYTESIKKESDSIGLKAVMLGQYHFDLNCHEVDHTVMLSVLGL